MFSQSIFASLRGARSDRCSCMQTSSSSATDDFLLTSVNDCTSAFYTHPPTTISLDQLKGMKRGAVISIDGAGSEEERKPEVGLKRHKFSSSLATVYEKEDLEKQAGCCPAYSKLARWQKVVLKISLGILILGIAITIGVTISWFVGGGEISINV